MRSLLASVMLVNWNVLSLVGAVVSRIQMLREIRCSCSPG